MLCTDAMLAEPFDQSSEDLIQEIHGTAKARALALALSKDTFSICIKLFREIHSLAHRFRLDSDTEVGSYHNRCMDIISHSRLQEDYLGL